MAAGSAKPLPTWTAPLVPVALALTAGIVLDRFCLLPLPATLGVALASALAWLVYSYTPQTWLALFYLLASVIAVSAAYHHWYRHHLPSSDISLCTDLDGRPLRLRGVLASAPITSQWQSPDALRAIPARDTTRFVLNVAQRQDLVVRRWIGCTGLVQVTLIGRVEEATVGDEVELLGHLALPGEVMNPGGFDYASFLRDQGITATLTVTDADELILMRRGWPTSLFGWLAVLRDWGQRTLARNLSSQHAIAAALLLGEGSGMASEDWDRYQHTGIVHVLAISGQHLVILAGALWLVTRTLGMRRRYSALFVALLLIGYALLTGGRPPVMRAAWTITAMCIGILIQRPFVRVNTFALAWILVILFNPTDVFNAGCQLSFLAVAMLMWGVGRWIDAAVESQSQPLYEAKFLYRSRVFRLLTFFIAPRHPLDQLVDESRGWQRTALIRLLRAIFACYLINATVWLAVAPLVAAHFHTVSPVALLIGPPVTLLTSVALLTGFLFLTFAGWCAPLAWPFAQATRLALALCEELVSFSHDLPGAFGYVADVPAWWLWIFYLGLLIGITLPVVWRHAPWALLAGFGWLALGVVLMLWPHRPGEFRCTFVAVGHGGCTVIEAPNGHVTVYDIGAMKGSNLTRKHVAPFLWARGIRRIDDVILSHADLDHFNGLEELARRFAIQRVICTPTFPNRDLPAMKQTLSALERREIPLRIAFAGRGWDVAGVAFDVLHPPRAGPAGKENARSLVLRVQYAGCAILLTGDLEDAGLHRVLALPPIPIDILMSPHHGSDKSNIPALAAWAKPKCVVSCEGRRKSERTGVQMYRKLGIPYLGTWAHGAVAVRHDAKQATVATYRTQLVFSLERHEPH